MKLYCLSEWRRMYGNGRLDSVEWNGLEWNDT